MKPEYIGLGNFDTMNYVYAYCKCPLPVDYAIKWPLIKDGKPHSYTCTCEDCGTTVSTIAKSYGPEVYKEIEMEATKRRSKQLYDEFGFFDPFNMKEKESNDYAVSIKEVHEAITRWAGSANVLAARLTSEVRSLLDSIHSLPPVTPQPKMGRWIVKEGKEEGYDIYKKDPESFNKWIGAEVLDRIRNELHATAEKHEDGVYYLRDEWIDEIFDKYNGKK